MKTAAARRDPFAVQAARLIALASAEVKGGFDGAPPQPRDALRWWQEKRVVSTAEWRQLSGQAQQRAFMVSQVVDLDLVRQVHAAIEKAIADGTGFEEFKAGLRDKLKLPEGRLETIWRTNLQQALNAGRQLQQRHPDVLESHPYWQFIAIEDGRTSVVCKACRNVVLRHDDPWWKTHQPPLHHRCRSTISALREREARQEGITKKAPAVPPAKGFGAELDLSDYEPDLTSYPPDLARAFVEKRKELEAKQAKEVPAPTPAEETLPVAPPPPIAPSPAQPAVPKPDHHEEVSHLPIAPVGPPVSSAMVVPSSTSTSGALAVQHALEAIDAVHGDGVLAPIPLLPDESLPKGVMGQMVYDRKTRVPTRIEMQGRQSTKAFHITHEVFHLLNLEAIGRPHHHELDVGRKSARAETEHLRAVVLGSPEVRRLVQLKGMKHFFAIDPLDPRRRKTRFDVPKAHVDYLLSGDEPFARAYAQFIAVQSGSTVLLAELSREQAATLPRQWADENFGPIRQAFIGLFRVLGWLK